MRYVSFFVFCLLLAPSVYAQVGFPDATTTGIVAADCPQYNANTISGSINANTAGQVIENRHVNGIITINAPNVTVKCVTINTSGNLYGINCFTANQCQSALIENVKIWGCANACMTAQGKPAGWMRANKVHLQGGTDDALKADGWLIFENSFIQNTYTPTPTSHNDAVQTTKNCCMLFRNNRIEGPFKAQTSAFIVKSDFGPISDIWLENNWLSGGAYTVYFRAGNNFPTPVRVIVSNNTFAQGSSQFLPPLSTDTGTAQCFEWRGNKYNDGTPYTMASSPAGSCASAFTNIPNPPPIEPPPAEPPANPTFNYEPSCPAFN